MTYWLFKSEPDTWSWDHQVAKGAAGEEWHGVRNYQARNNMRAMEIGDLGSEERREIDGRLAGRGKGFEDALNEASVLLSGLAGGAGIVASPVRTMRSMKR